MFSWPTFSRILTEYGHLQIESPYLAQMRKNEDQKISEYGNFHVVQSASENIFKLS